MAKIGKDQLFEPKPLQLLRQLDANSRLQWDHFGPALLVLEPVIVLQQATRYRCIPVLAEVCTGLVVVKHESENSSRARRQKRLGRQGTGYTVDVNLKTHYMLSLSSIYF